MKASKRLVTSGWRARILLGLIVVTASLAGLVPGAHGDHSVTALVSAGGVGAFDADFEGMSGDGTRVFFETSESLVGGDSDSSFDVYQRAGGTTTLISTGPAGGNGAFGAFFDGTSDDGTRAFFETDESLVAGDTDTSQDIYERAGGTTTLISTGPAGGNGAFNAGFRATSDDGTRTFFETDESLVSGDTDSSQDVYERAGSVTALVSVGGNGAFSAFFDGTSDDGTRVFFGTIESLVAGDSDTSGDVYERAGGTTTLISTGPAGGNGAFNASFRETSDDGTRTFFETSESLTAGDSDTSFDVYERAGGTTTLISTGTAGGNGVFDADFEGISNDGTTAFFETSESLVAGDTDASQDVYERAGGTTTLISTGPAGGNGAFNADFRATSDDGTRAFFRTNESLVSGDTDTSRDVYERTGATTTLISTGPAGGNGAFSANFRDMSGDGTRVFFVTAESLVSGDSDTDEDVYERSVDLSAPETTIDSGPEATTSDNTPTFTFSASEPATFECRIDAASFAPCTSPLTTAALADGARTFEVQATDAVGNTDLTPASLAFTIDTQAPDTTIDSGPEGTTPDNTPTFTFSASETATFDCRIDAASFAPCTSPHTTIALADGLRTFEVRAIDVVGHLDSTPASRTFTIDTEGLVDSKVTIAFNRSKGTFSGRVTATTDDPDLKDSCLERRRVVLRQKTPGRDAVGGKAKTDSGGKWRIEGFETATGRYYAVVKGKVLEQDGATVTCGLDRSKTISI